MIVRIAPEQVVLRDGGGWRWFVAGVLLGVGVPLLLRFSSAATAIVGVALAATGAWLLWSTPRIVSVFDARTGSVVVARRRFVGRRSTQRVSLADVEGVELAPGGRLVLVVSSPTPDVPLSGGWASRPAVARGHAAVSSFLLRVAR